MKLIVYQTTATVIFEQYRLENRLGTCPLRRGLSLWKIVQSIRGEQRSSLESRGIVVRSILHEAAHEPAHLQRGVRD